MGSGLALRWALAGHRILLGSRSVARARDMADRLNQIAGSGASVEGVQNTDAVAGADVAVLCVPFAAHAATLRSLRPSWRDGMVLVDVTVPLAAAVGGSATEVLGVPAGSAAEQAARLVPASVRVCAAFHHIGAAHLHDPAHDLEGDVLLCGNDRAARAVVADLVRAIPRLRPIEVGPLRRARLIEPITALLISVNARYKVMGAGIRITGLPESVA